MSTKLKEIIFCCYGDSTNASTWSNVPYLFTKTLENKGIIVRRVDLNVFPFLTKLYRHTIFRILNIFYPQHQYSFQRTAIFQFFVNQKIKRAVRIFNKADFCIFTCFDFCNKYGRVPSLLFCDWTYEVLIRDRLGRELYPFEKRFSKQQDKAINRAEYIVSLFPVCTETMKKKYPYSNISYLGGNVINSLFKGKIDVTKTIEKKFCSNRILFIGAPKYKEGLQLLVNSLNKLQNVCELHVIGMERYHVNNAPHNVIFHGYLRKDVESERKLYYDLVLSAKMLVNPTEKWAGYSSTIEVMSFYTPVIVSRYEDFVKEFSEDINFGIYNDDFTIESLAKNINAVLNYSKEEYFNSCMNAHHVVNSYTWDSYVDRLLNLINP